MMYQQKFWFTWASRLPAKSGISLSLDALCPGTFFLSSEIDVTDGVFSLKKKKKLRFSKIGNLLCDKNTFRSGCGSLGGMLPPHWEQKLLHLLSSKCVYVVLKSWTFQSCFKRNSSPNPPSAPSLSSSPKASKLPTVAARAQWHRADQPCTLHTRISLAL